MIPCEHCGDEVSQLYRVVIGENPYAVCLMCNADIKRGVVPAGKLSRAIASAHAHLIVARYNPFPRTPPTIQGSPSHPHTPTAAASALFKEQAK